MLGAGFKGLLLIALMGAALGAVFLLFMQRSNARTQADFGFVLLNAMLAIYIGARLVSGSFQEVLIETAIASVFLLAARLAMNHWLPAIGIAIIIHGMYDAALGAHTGVALWYPPLCAGFDWAFGIGLAIILHRKVKAGEAY